MVWLAITLAFSSLQGADIEFCYKGKLAGIENNINKINNGYKIWNYKL